jgi:hypothetical protein
MLQFASPTDWNACYEIYQHVSLNPQSRSSMLLWNNVLGKKDRPAFIIRDDAGDPYLLRVYLTGNSDEGKVRKVPRAYLHFFFRGDNDRELHSHPWETFMPVWPFNLFGSMSIILTGGYVEERLTKTGQVRVKRYGPGSVNVLRGQTFHRVQLSQGGTWTLFLAGRRSGLPKGEDWGFLDVATGAYETFNAREARKEAEARARIPNITPLDPKAFDDLPGRGSTEPIDPSEYD